LDLDNAPTFAYPELGPIQEVIAVLVRLDRGARLPLYVQIRQQLRELILSGALPPESRLPATRDLARALGVNRTTVIAAYRQLWSAGLVEGRAGGGTVVTATPPAQAPAPDVPPGPLVWDTRYTSRIQSFHAARIFRLVQQAPPGTIRFCLGVPPDGRTPVHVARNVLEETVPKGMRGLQDAPYACINELRGLIAKRTDLTGIHAAPSEVLVLSGRAQGISLLAQALLDPGDTLAMEVPTSPGAVQVFHSLGASICPVPMDENGLRLDVLEGLLAHQRPKLLYVAPTFHNPTGITVDLEHRRALLDLCQRYRTPILEEDAYHDLRYERATVTPLKALDRHNHVLYLSTYSETFFPGLPLAWLIGPKEVIERLEGVQACMDETPSCLGQHVIHGFLTHGADETARIVSHYASRRDAMCAALEKHCHEIIHWRRPHGGFFIWGRLEGNLKSELVLREALQEGVAFLPGSAFFPNGNGGENELRLDFAGQPEDRIEQGIKRLGVALRRSLDQKFPRRERPLSVANRDPRPFGMIPQGLGPNL
jgi:2-aminoadipate transaminase